jgi:hypothetical protein
MAASTATMGWNGRIWWLLDQFTGVTAKTTTAPRIGGKLGDRSTCLDNDGPRGGSRSVTHDTLGRTATFRLGLP